jgi:hypothetical protein
MTNHGFIFEEGYIFFHDEYSIVDNFLKLSAMLINSGIEITENHQFEFKSVEFRPVQINDNSFTGSHSRIDLFCKESFISAEWITTLIQRLFESGVIFKNSGFL